MVAENYLDFYQFFVNDVVGGIIPFMILGSIFIAYACSKANAPSGVTIMLLLLFNIFMTYFIWAALPVILFVVSMIAAMAFKYWNR